MVRSWLNKHIERWVIKKTKNLTFPILYKVYIYTKYCNSYPLSPIYPLPVLQYVHNRTVKYNDNKYGRVQKVFSHFVVNEKAQETEMPQLCGK